MDLDVPKPEGKTGSKAPLRATAPGSPRKGPPKFKQRNTRQFKSKPPKRGVIGFGEEIPGMEGLGTGKENEHSYCIITLKPIHKLHNFSFLLLIISSFFFRHHCNLPMGSLQPPGAT
uniref:3',5'-cyclic-GMP phosphodiesterase n=1 Tax=Lates calcarifer TaxID=8187 RepID=A0A4W6G0B1_LATCA